MLVQDLFIVRRKGACDSRRVRLFLTFLVMLTGCCELGSLGWRKRVPPRERSAVVRVSVGELPRERPLAFAACSAICGKDREALLCEETRDPVTLDPPNSVVLCEGRTLADDPVRGRRTTYRVGAYSGWLAPAGTQLAKGQCSSLCTDPRVSTDGCRVETRGPLPQATDVHVRCTWTEPSHCGGSGMSLLAFSRCG